jgi:hypothetical protein
MSSGIVKVIIYFNNWLILTILMRNPEKVIEKILSNRTLERRGGSRYYPFYWAIFDPNFTRFSTAMLKYTQGSADVAFT